jgi:hypothetical protein
MDRNELARILDLALAMLDDAIEAGDQRASRSLMFLVRAAWNALREADRPIEPGPPESSPAPAAPPPQSERRSASSLSAAELSERARRANAALTPEERSERGRRSNARLSPLERSNRARRGWETRWRKRQASGDGSVQCAITFNGTEAPTADAS